MFASQSKLILVLQKQCLCFRSTLPTATPYFDKLSSEISRIWTLIFTLKILKQDFKLMFCVQTRASVCAVELKGVALAS